LRAQIFQSFNHLIRNLLIRESPNQLINQSRKHRRAAAKIRVRCFKFRLLPGEGQSNPKTQTSRGGGLIASASGIGRFPVVRSPANPEGSRSSGKLGLRGNYDSRNVRARERLFGYLLPCGDSCTDFLHREPNLQHASRAREKKSAVANKKGFAKQYARARSKPRFY
jgi:hypothetical protein